MGAGRPYNSTTPAWRSKPAIKVCAYKLHCYLNGIEATKSECARIIGASRVTVIKWWNTVDWEHGDFDKFRGLFRYQTDLGYTLEEAAKEVKLDDLSMTQPHIVIFEYPEIDDSELEKARLLDEIREEYIRAYKSQEYVLKRHYKPITRSKAVWKGKRRWKR